MNIEEIANIHKALSEPIRLRIMMLLMSGELCVCEIEDVLDEPQPKVSRHLSYLKACGLISSRRSKRWVYYQIKDSLHPSLRLLIDHIGKTLKNEEWAIKDANKLEQVKAKRLCN